MAGVAKPAATTWDRARAVKASARGEVSRSTPGRRRGRKAWAQRLCSGAWASTAVEATAQKLRALLSSDPRVSSQVRS